MIKDNLPSDWKSTNFGEIFDFEKKSKHKASEGKEKGYYKFFTSSNIQKKFIDGFDFDGDFLVFGTGGSASMHNPSGKFSTSTDCLIAKINNNQILTKYVYYYISANMHLLNAGFKGAGLKHISKKYIQSIEINYPNDIEIQKKIVAILEKAERLKEWRKEADELTDEFLKSTFLEMFGDPVTNTKGFKTQKLGDISDVKSGLTLNGQRRANKNNLHPYLRVANVFRNKLDLSEIKYIHVSDSEINKFLLKKNDVLIVEGHGNIEEIGRAAVWNEDIPNCVHQNHIIRARLDEKHMHAHFLTYFLNIYGNFGYFPSKSRTTSGLNTISTNKVRKAEILSPPIALQQKFASIVQHVEQLREHQSQSRQHIDDLFNVLMQKAFKGELN